MISFGQLERRFGWLSFPGFLRYYALMHVLVFVLQFIRPDIGLLLDFDKAKIASGEVWRVVTFFFAGSSVGRPSMVSILFLACAVNFMFMVNDGLEGAWGSFKTSIFCYTGMISILAANVFYPIAIPFSGFALYASAFLAFALMYPRMEILLMFILPVQVGLLGVIEGGLILLMVISKPALLPFVLVAFANFIFWAGIPALRGTARVVESAQRRRKFNAARMPEQEAFYTCAKCGRTDVTDPQLEFRVAADGREYCADHLPE
jgi:hypothetical protein